VLKGIIGRRYVYFAAVAAIVYCIPVTFFLIQADYVQTWLLYLGNFLFLVVVVQFLFSFNKKRDENAGIITMLTAGGIVTVMGIIFSLFLSFLLILILVPGVFHSPAGKVLEHAPANTEKGNTNGLVFKVIINAIIGNIATGFFVSTLFPFSLKGDQTKESTEGSY